MVGPCKLAVAAVFIGALAPGVHAQHLAAGTWTGTMSPPDNDDVAVTYDIVAAGDSLAITMHGPGERQVPFTHIRFEDGKLLFEWNPGGTDIQCTLEPQADGGYQGPCTDSEGKTGHLAMVPPKP